MRGRVLKLYELKERVANALGDGTSAANLKIFVNFDSWFEDITFNRHKPDIADVIFFETAFADMSQDTVSNKIPKIIET